MVDACSGRVGAPARVSGPVRVPPVKGRKTPAPAGGLNFRKTLPPARVPAARVSPTVGGMVRSGRIVLPIPASWANWNARLDMAGSFSDQPLHNGTAIAVELVHSNPGAGRCGIGGRIDQRPTGCRDLRGGQAVQVEPAHVNRIDYEPVRNTAPDDVIQPGGGDTPAHRRAGDRDVFGQIDVA